MGLLDFLFPRYCVSCKKIGSYLCDSCFAYISFSSSAFCLACGRSAVDGITHPPCLRPFTIDGVFSVLSYKGVVKKLLYVFKYKPYVSDLISVLTDLFYEGLIQNEGFMSTILRLRSVQVPQLNNRAMVFVPIPLHAKKLRSRGYNHTQYLAEGLSKKFGIPVQNLLTRQKETSSQFKLSREERRKNISGAFGLSNTILLLLPRRTTIIIVDDLLTTGATLLEAAKTLKRAGYKKVWGITLAID